MRLSCAASSTFAASSLLLRSDLVRSPPLLSAGGTVPDADAPSSGQVPDADAPSSGDVPDADAPPTSVPDPLERSKFGTLRSAQPANWSNQHCLQTITGWMPPPHCHGAGKLNPSKRAASSAWHWSQEPQGVFTRYLPDLLYCWQFGHSQSSSPSRPPMPVAGTSR